MGRLMRRESRAHVSGSLAPRAVAACVVVGWISVALPALAQPAASPLADGVPTSSPIWTGVALSALALLPFALVVTTSFAKIAVVLSLLRSALGAPNVPPNTVLASLAFLLSAYVMAPVAALVFEAAAPLLAMPRAPATPADALAWLNAIANAGEPLRAFLEANAGAAELETFAGLRGAEPSAWSVVVPAFAITELSEAFQIGFLLFLPFLVLDLLVGSVLLSLGMHMLAPASVSMPFKLLLFVSVNGWLLLSESLVLAYTFPGSP